MQTFDPGHCKLGHWGAASPFYAQPAGMSAAYSGPANQHCPAQRWPGAGRERGAGRRGALGLARAALRTSGSAAVIRGHLIAYFRPADALLSAPLLHLRSASPSTVLLGPRE